MAKSEDNLHLEINDEQFAQFCRDADLKTPARAAAELRKYQVPNEVVDRLVERYENHVAEVRSASAPQALEEGNRRGWYGGPRPDDACWPALVEKLEPSLDGSALDAVDKSTTGIVGLLEHPAVATFAIKGLVLGHVQSGKTTNYTGVIAKAADRNYRLIIVLAGIHNELRRQTQTRLVGHLVAPDRTMWHQLTDPEHDFRPVHNAPAYFAEFSQQKVLCVVKKNAAVLRRLIAWLEEAEDQLRDIPAIVIDDEADQAAVATRTINPLILRLLSTLPRANYVGYTATPFANLLIDPASEDLYPRHFIVDLPTPEGHFGTESIFGREPFDDEDPADYEDGALDMVRLVPAEEVGSVRPATKEEVDGFAPQVDGELLSAIQYFWLATAARRVRGGGAPHSTMLVHTSLRVAVHESFKPPIEAEMARTFERLAEGDVRLFNRLRALWESEHPRVPAGSFGHAPIDFDEVLPQLAGVIADCRVIVDNSRSEDRLDYTTEPVVAIAVGGNTLSRGLTLEGLVVSYFVRSATAYDTLLQMGRWFGYRDGYEELPRIWMTEELHGWFRHLAGVEAEIRKDIARYIYDGVDPLTFATRIREHPSLRITAAAKMKDAVTAASAYGGLRIQTRFFRADDLEWLEANQDAARALVKDAHDEVPFEELPGGFLWRDVPVGAVLSFLDRYTVHEKAVDNSTSLLTKYIEDRNAKERLRQWNVALIGSTSARKGSFDFGSGIEVPRVVRSKLAHSAPAEADIKTLMSRRDAAVDLSVPAGESLTEGRIVELRREQAPDTPLLAIYVIDAESESPTSRRNREPLGALSDAIGLGIVFPKPPPGEEDSEVTYVSADLSKLTPTDGYLEEEIEDDLAALEGEDDA